MRKLLSLTATGLLALSLGATNAVPAQADGPECNPINHCYGIAHYPTGNIDAVGQELWTDCLALDDVVNDFATHEMWMLTNAPNSSAMNPFIETGYVRGYIAGGDPDNWFRWFWAEWTGTGFYSHYVSAAPILNWINFSLYKQGNNTWKVYVNGVERGTTVQQATAGTYVQTGGETTEPQVYSHGKSRYLQWHPVGASGWTWGQGAIPAGTTNVYAVTTNAWERMEQVSQQKLCDPLPGGPIGLNAAKAPDVADLKALATTFAALNGEKAPKVDMVDTKRGAAQKQLKAGAVDSDQGVYLIQMTGAFTAGLAPRPKDSPAPTGSTITLTIDKATGELTDWSLSNERTNLAKLGTVKSL